MAGKDRLFLIIGDRSILNYTAVDKNSRDPVNMSGASAKVRQTIWTNPNDPTGSTVTDKTITATPDASNGEILGGGTTGLFRFIYIPADLASESEAIKKFYYFATKLLDVNGDPSTVERGICTLGPLVVTTP